MYDFVWRFSYWRCDRLRNNHLAYLDPLQYVFEVTLREVVVFRLCQRVELCKGLVTTGLVNNTTGQQKITVIATACQGRT